MFGYQVQAVIALYKEEVTGIVCIALRLEEVPVLPDIFFHVAMCIQAVVSLQLCGQSWSGIGQ